MGVLGKPLVMEGGVPPQSMAESTTISNLFMLTLLKCSLQYSLAQVSVAAVPVQLPALVPSL